MAHDLPSLVRAAFNIASMELHDTAAAFEKAVETLMRRRPLLSEDEARQEVATALGIDLVELLRAGGSGVSP